jgi:hypothetical protein
MNVGSTELLNKLFITAYLTNGRNIGLAYNTALVGIGKEEVRLSSACTLGGRILKKKDIDDIIQAEELRLRKLLEREFVEEKKKIIDKCWETYEKSMEEQVTYDRNGKALDRHDINSLNNATKTLELLAKISGLLVERVESRNENTQINNGIITVEVV